MEEKVLIEGVFKNHTLPYKICAILGAVLLLLSLFLFIGSLVALAIIPLMVGFVLLFMGLLCTHFICECELTVTDKRIYGSTELGHEVNIPLSKISSVSLGGFNGIYFSYAGNNVGFYFCQNVDDVYEVVSELLIKTSDKNNVDEISNAEEIKKYNELLDCGAITKEEFEKKKKQLLGL